MIPSLKNRLHSCLSAAALVVTSLAITGCGGGGGSSDPSREPAPQTLNAIKLKLFPGFDLVFVRDSGNVLDGGVETGTVVISEQPGTAPENSAIDLITLTDTKITPPTRVYLATYTYDRTGVDSGKIVVSGSSVDEGENVANYMAPAADFERNYNIVFATADGLNITSIVVNDWGEATPAPGISWTGADLSLYSGDPVPIGYSLEMSRSQALPYLFPERKLDGLFFDIIPDLGGAYYAHEFVTSTVTVFERGVTAEDRGSGLALDINIGGEGDTINYIYIPDRTTIDKAVIQIVNTATPASFPQLTKTYTLTFGDYTSGTYIDSSGNTGEFRFPNINLD